MKKKKSYEETAYDNYIPIPISELTNRISTHCRIIFRRDEEAEQLQDLFEILIYYYHHKLYEKLRRLKYVYYPFSPDNELFTDFELDKEFDIEEGNFRSEFLDIFLKYMEKSNYEEVPNEVIYTHLHPTEKSPEERRKDWLRGFSTYTFRRTRKEMMLYAFYRGAVNDKHPTLLSKLLRWSAKETPIENLPLINRQKRFQLYNTLITLYADSKNKYHLKLFKEVNSEKLVHLFPTSLVKLKIGFWAWIMMFLMLVVSLWLGFSKGTKWFGALPKGAATVAIIAVILFFVSKFVLSQRTKQAKKEFKRVKKQAHQLLAANMNVINDIGYEAEEEELKELILGYYGLFLRQHEKVPDKFDGNIKAFIEDFLHTHCHIQKKMNFEVTDAIRKLLEGGFFKEQSLSKLYNTGYISEVNLHNLTVAAGLLTEGELLGIVDGEILLDEARLTELIEGGLFRLPGVGSIIKENMLSKIMLQIFLNEGSIDKERYDFLSSFPNNPMRFFDRSKFQEVQKTVINVDEKSEDKKDIVARESERLNEIASTEIDTGTRIITQADLIIDKFIDDENNEGEEKLFKELKNTLEKLKSGKLISSDLLDDTLLDKLNSLEIFHDEGYAQLKTYRKVVEELLYEALQKKMVSEDFLLGLNELIIHYEIMPYLQVREPMGAFQHVDNIWDKLFVSFEEQAQTEEAEEIDKFVSTELEEGEKSTTFKLTVEKSQKDTEEESAFNENDNIFHERIERYSQRVRHRHMQIDSVLNDLHNKFDGVLQRRRQNKVEEEAKVEQRRKRHLKINRIGAILGFIILIGFLFLGWFDLNKIACELNLDKKALESENLLTGLELLINSKTDDVLSCLLLTQDRTFPFRIFLFLIPFVGILLVFKTYGARSFIDYAGRWSLTIGVVLVVFIFAWINSIVELGSDKIVPSIGQIGLWVTFLGLIAAFVLTFIYTSFSRRLLVVLIVLALSLDLLFEHYSEQLSKLEWLNKFFGL